MIFAAKPNISEVVTSVKSTALLPHKEVGDLDSPSSVIKGTIVVALFRIFPLYGHSHVLHTFITFIQ